MTRGLFLCLSGLMIIQTGSVAGQVESRKSVQSNYKVERFESRPNLGIKFQDVAQLKIASRKSTFHTGEMITLDIALLNTASEPVFFRKLSELQINVTSPAGQKIMVQAYGVAERAVIPASFVPLPPGEILVHSFQLLPGCDKRAFAQIASSEEDDRAVFNRGSFLSWGDACLPSPQPQTYTLSFELKNNFVLLPLGRRELRSAVGTIGSNSLNITILD